MTTPGALHSDHVNYLIFRYLQEHGHENTARAFWRDWRRPREFREPESLPFARAVHRHELVSVIQDGLRHDELQSRVTRGERRFRWSMIDPRRNSEADADNQEPNGSRPPSSGKRKSIGVRQDETIAPAVKRPRLGDTQVNGHRDAMDIDGRSSSAEENEDDANAVSPAVASDAGDALAMRYDSVATQTEVANGQRMPPSRLKPRSITLDINKEASKIFHAAWGPDRSNRSKNALFITGESLCRMYRTPDHLNDTRSVEHMDEPAVSRDCMVTAMAWHPQGRMLTCAVDTIGMSQDGKQMNTRRVISIGPDVGGTYTHFPNSEFLQPPGVALRVEYSPNGDYLMIARTNGDRGVIEIWPALHSQVAATTPSTQPIAWKIFEHSLSDAAWCGERQLMVCTHTEHAWVLKLSEELTHTTAFTGDSIALHSFVENEVVLPPSGEVDTTYKHDATHGIDVFFVRPYDQESAQDQMVIIDASLYDTEAYLKAKQTFDLDWTFVTSAVQPAKKTDLPPSEVISNYGPARLLATIAESGGCRLFELNRDSNGVICKPLFNEGGYSLKMSYGPALAVAWSPDGTHLAMAGTNLVQVWQATGTTIDNRPVLTWRTGKSSLEEVEHANGIGREASKPICLTWDAPGEKICFAFENKVCCA